MTTLNTKIDINPEIKIVKLAEIISPKSNPRQISNNALSGLQKSLEQFGYVDLMIINKRNMQIVGGNQRYKILKQANIKEVPAILLDLDETKEQLLNVTLNNTEIMGVFNEMLIPLLEKFRQENPEEYLDLQLKELRKEYDQFEPENMGAGKTLPDDIPGIPKKTITQSGDLWILGDHRLLCGSSTNEDDVARLMDGHQASLFATDPPYCVDYTGKDRPTKGKDWSNVYREIDIPDAKDFIRQFYTVGLKYIKKNTALYLWHASSRLPEIKQVCDELDILLHQQIIWVKPYSVLTYSIYSWRHEPSLLE